MQTIRRFFMIVTIDRFEGDFAVCLTDEKVKIDIPTALLPDGSKEGKIYDMQFIELIDEEEKRRERITSKAKKLWAD